jgi:hypothetical protein
MNRQICGTYFDDNGTVPSARANNERLSTPMNDHSYAQLSFIDTSRKSRCGASGRNEFWGVAMEWGLLWDSVTSNRQFCCNCESFLINRDFPGSARFPLTIPCAFPRIHVAARSTLKPETFLSVRVEFGEDNRHL